MHRTSLGFGPVYPVTDNPAIPQSDNPVEIVLMSILVRDHDNRLVHLLVDLPGEVKNHP
jgi:hypothetical protein